MSPRAHFYIAVIILTGVFSPFGMSILDGKQQDSAKKLANYHETLASITKAKEIRSRRNGSTVYISYSFQADDGKIFTGSDSISLREWKQNPGEKPIRIYYDPFAPSRNNIARSVDDYAEERPLAFRLGVGAILGSPFAIIGASIWAWIVSWRSKRKQMKSL